MPIVVNSVAVKDSTLQRRASQESLRADDFSNSAFTYWHAVCMVHAEGAYMRIGHGVLDMILRPVVASMREADLSCEARARVRLHRISMFAKMVWDVDAKVPGPID